MSTVGSIPAAAAWTAVERAISPPSEVTAALRERFRALKGATRRLRRRRKRHSPATTTLLPTCEAVPWTMRTGAVTTDYPGDEQQRRSFCRRRQRRLRPASELDSFLGFDSRS